MAGHFYSVVPLRRGCKVRVRARNIDAKQVLFGWGAGRGVAAEFYGRGTRRGTGDNEIWEWTLSQDGIAELRRVLALGQERGKERRAAKALLRKIERAVKRLGTKCRR